MKFIDTEGSKEGRFVPGDPKVGERPTRLDHTWCNMIQDEIANVILKQKMTLDQSGKNNSQLFDAMKRFLTHGIEYDAFHVQNGTNKTLISTPVKLEIPVRVRAVFFNAYVERQVKEKRVISIYDGIFVRKDQGSGWNSSPLIQTIGGDDDISFDIGADGTIQYSCIKLGNDGDSYSGVVKISHVRMVEV